MYVGREQAVRAWCAGGHVTASTWNRTWKPRARPVAEWVRWQTFVDEDDSPFCVRPRRQDRSPARTSGGRRAQRSPHPGRPQIVRGSNADRTRLSTCQGFMARGRGDVCRRRRPARGTVKVGASESRGDLGRLTHVFEALATTVFVRPPSVAPVKSLPYHDAEQPMRGQVDLPGPSVSRPKRVFKRARARY